MGMKIKADTQRDMLNTLLRLILRNMREEEVVSVFLKDSDHYHSWAGLYRALPKYCQESPMGLAYEIMSIFSTYYNEEDFLEIIKPIFQEILAEQLGAQKVVIKWK